MKKSLIGAVVIVMSGLSLAWAGHFTDILPPASAAGCVPVSNGYDYNCSTDSSAPTPTFNGATISGNAVTQSSTTFTGGVILPPKNLAQLQALTPGTTGQLYWCTNCSWSSVCIATGTTAAYSFAGVSVTTGTTSSTPLCK